MGIGVLASSLARGGAQEYAKLTTGDIEEQGGQPHGSRRPHARG